LPEQPAECPPRWNEADGVASALGLTLSVDQSAGLTRYLDLLQRWNGTYNLTAVREREAMLTQHVADCLSVVRPLQARLATGRVLDVGSGGGLPGVLLALLHPGWQVTCVDAVAKKAAFIRQVAGSLGLRGLHAVHARVENMAGTPFDVITSRAFSSLADLVRLTARHLAPGGCWMAMKGKLPVDEMGLLPPEVEVFHVEHLQVPGLTGERCLVWMRRKHPPELLPPAEVG
jgi:16S rRNA (guanine527-N7)-methyltransferase